MFRNYQYLLRPDPGQKAILEFMLEHHRKFYNAALEQRIKIYQESGKRVTGIDQWLFLKELRSSNPETFGWLPSDSMVQTLRRLDKAYAAFFRGLKRDDKTGFPKFKSRKCFLSFEIRHRYGCRLVWHPSGCARLYLKNVGEIRMCYHRPVPPDGRIKNVTFKTRNGQWFVYLKIELPDPHPAAPSGRVIGIDVGLRSMLALSDGTLIENPHWRRKNLARLRVLHRQADRRRKGSRRQAFAYRRVSRQYRTITNQQRDYLHKITKWLVETYSLIAIEDLPLAFISRNKNLALSAGDVNLYRFRKLLEYKARAAGVLVVAVDPKFTSQRCSNCGELVEKELRVRVHNCPFCGLVLDRDVNAARNILQTALDAVESNHPQLFTE